MISTEAWIPLSDGTRLSARVWRPAAADKVPAILEYLPYHHRDGTWERDARTYPFFSAHGYAGVRVDIRGSGESGGLLHDEYTKQEQDDALEVIAWIARQTWCSGAVGMMGISWGGFNALQVAARRPPALRAIITVCSTDDRYADDVHYMGGAMLTSNFGWAFALQFIQAHPPDPAVVGEAWRAMWRERLEAMPLFIGAWLRHQARDAYWRHGSVCENWDAIACPVFAVGGWTDGYTNAIPRMLANLRVSSQALIGPWAHKYPHMGVPGPAAGFPREALAWWDRWLKAEAEETGGETPLRAWMMDSVRPAPMYRERPGRWISEPTWPPSTTARKVFLTAEGLGDAPDAFAATICTPGHLGGTGGNWCPFGLTPDDADDQCDDDALSVSWDSAPLPERMEILGAPELELDLRSDTPHAVLIARLCDVHPDGASLRVSYGVLNLAHRDGHAEPKPLEPGRHYTIRLRLNDAAFAFPPGHRIRLALSTTYWPMVWPSPSVATLRIDRGASVTLPMRTAREQFVDVAPVEPTTLAGSTVLCEGRSIRERGRDISAGEWFWRSVETPSRIRIDSIGTEIESESSTECRIRADDPLSARIDTKRVETVLREGKTTRTALHATMHGTAKTFVVDATLDAFEEDTIVCQRRWRHVSPRDDM